MMHFRLTPTIFLVLFINFFVFACAPGDSADGVFGESPSLQQQGLSYSIHRPCEIQCQQFYSLSQAALKRELYDLMKGHHSLGYKGARQVMFSDLDLEGAGSKCIYTGTEVKTNGHIPSNNIMDCEHTWPQSWGAKGISKSDLHHLFPTMSKANSIRGNLPFGWVFTRHWSEGGSSQGEDERGEEVFEVRDDHKGDTARAMFYFAVRYNQSLYQKQEEVLRQWHEEDPPDDYERTRNEVIYHYQNNRNLFIDCPSLVERIADF